jgi:Zn-dependent membrane protease YugP
MNMNTGYLPLYGFDTVSIILLVAGAVIAGFAQARVRSAYSYYARMSSARGVSGSLAAQSILRQNGVEGVFVEMGQGTLSDNYNPRTKIIKLSPDIYQSSSIASVAVAAHETGHALQHQQKYFFLSFRHLLAPVANVASFLAFPLILLGLVMSYPALIDIGVYAFAATLLFQIITLPVEYDASKRALHALLQTGTITEDETTGVRRMLNAAALTYVAATIVTFLNLLRLVLLARRRD